MRACMCAFMCFLAAKCTNVYHVGRTRRTHLSTSAHTPASVSLLRSLCYWCFVFAQRVWQQPAAKRRRWYLGIQSKKDPAHVMTEVYRALLQLGCEWRMLSSYGI